MAKKALDELLGGVTRFGDYTVLGDGPHHPKVRLARCRCACGTIRNVETAKLRSGRSTCCKTCAGKSAKRITGMRHGMSATPEYDAWSSMKSRCNNPDAHNYARYGGRGITICSRWQEGFEAFFDDMGPRPKGGLLDRIDNDGNYEPGNCRWATRVQQSANRRCTYRVDDEALSIKARERGLSVGAVRQRVKRGWSLEQALNAPVEDRKPRHWVHGEHLKASEIAAKYGTTRARFNKHIRDGRTPEEAVTLG